MDNRGPCLHGIPNHQQYPIFILSLPVSHSQPHSQPLPPSLSPSASLPASPSRSHSQSLPPSLLLSLTPSLSSLDWLIPSSSYPQSHTEPLTSCLILSLTPRLIHRLPRWTHSLTPPRRSVEKICLMTSASSPTPRTPPHSCARRPPAPAQAGRRWDSY